MRVTPPTRSSTGWFSMSYSGFVCLEDCLRFVDQLAGTPDAHRGPERDVHHSAGGRNQLSVSEDR